MAIITGRIRRGIPYWYEPYLHDVGAKGRAPDFLIKDPVTGAIILWEHLGKLADDQYCEAVDAKLDEYAAVGWIAGHNLIITGETLTHPLSQEDIDKQIDAFFGLAI